MPNKASMMVVATGLALAATCAPADLITIGGRTYVRKEFPIAGAHPCVSYAPDGSFAVLWDIRRAIRIRRFARDGTPLTGNVTVAAHYRADYPSIAPRSDGSFFVCYQYCWYDGPRDLRGRIIAPDGSPITGELSINTYTSGPQVYPKVAMNANDEALVVWQSEEQLGQGPEVIARRFDATGQPLSPESVVNTTVAGYQDFPDVAMSASGRAMVVWASHGGGQPSAVCARQYEPSGIPTGPESTVGWEAGKAAYNAHVAMNDAGAAVAVWEQTPAGSIQAHIYFRRYDLLGQPVGDPCQVTDSTYLASTVPYVDLWDDGSFVVTWYEYANPQSDCYARLFDSEGAPASDVFVVNGLTAGKQTSPKVACGPAGEMVFVWRHGPDDAYVTLLIPEPATLSLLMFGALALLRRRRRR